MPRLEKNRAAGLAGRVDERSENVSGKNPLLGERIQVRASVNTNLPGLPKKTTSNKKSQRLTNAYGLITFSKTCARLAAAIWVVLANFRSGLITDGCRMMAVMSLA